MNILTECSGSLVSSFFLRAIKDAGFHSIATDVTDNAVGRLLSDSFFKIPEHLDINLWSGIAHLLEEFDVDVVFPSYEPTLSGWAAGNYRGHSCVEKTYVVVSPKETVDCFTDKWRAFQWFINNNITTPETSLDADYEYVKPRHGSGSKGHYRRYESKIDAGFISQAFISGKEYTVDILCKLDGSPRYIIPRKRLVVSSGKSVVSQTVEHVRIIKLCRDICSKAHFIGPINVQIIEDAGGKLWVLEINVRSAGGLALSFAASENWIPLCVDIMRGQPLQPTRPVRFGLKMFRYYNEIFE